MKKIIGILLIIFLLLAICITYYYANSMQNSKRCTAVEIKFINANDNPLIDKNYIFNIIKNEKIELIGVENNKIKLDKISKLLNHNPFISYANITIDINNTAKILIKQRKAIARISLKNGINFYLASDGAVMPISVTFPQDVIFCNGNISEPYKKQVYTYNHDTLLNPDWKSIKVVAEAIANNSFLNSIIEQIYINNETIELISKLGRQTIILGDTTKLNDKFFNLSTFLKHVSLSEKWKEYNKINIMFENQVVCIK